MSKFFNLILSCAVATPVLITTCAFAEEAHNSVSSAASLDGASSSTLPSSAPEAKIPADEEAIVLPSDEDLIDEDYDVLDTEDTGDTSEEID